MKKNLIFIITFFVASTFLFAKGNADKTVYENQKIIASTSWTAAFAEIAGIDGVTSIAPASLQHPPEYEITVSDIEKINKSEIFIYAGFERMMKTLGENVSKTQMVKIHCTNSLENVKAESAKIAAITHTEKENQKRFALYEEAILKAREELKAKNLFAAKVMCNVNQIYLAKDLGFKIEKTFGPGNITSNQLLEAKNGDFTFIIDNVHNPVAKPLCEVAPSAKYIIWRNFPEKMEANALLHVVEGNIKSVLE